MTLAQTLALGLFVTPFVNWPVFILLLVAARRHPGIRSLTHFRWLSLAIALLSTTFCAVFVARLFGLVLSPEITTVLIVGPIYVLTATNGVFLWLTWQRRW